MQFKKTTFFLYLILAFSLNIQLHAQPKNTLDEQWYSRLIHSIDRTSAEKLISETEIKLQEAIDINRPALESQFSKELAWVHLLKTRNLKVAMEYAVEALNIDEKNQFKTHLMFTNILLSQIFIEVADYYNAADYTQKALELNRTIDYASIQIELKQQLGNIFMQMAQYEEAQDQYENILAYAKSSRHPKLEAKNWYQIGELEQIQKHFQLAINAYLNALKIQRRINEIDQEGTTLLAIGKSYQLMDDYDRALENYKVALNIWRTLEEPEGIAQSYNSLGELFLQNKEYDRAIANLQYGLNNAQLAQSQSLRFESYELLSKAYKALGAYKEALEYQDLKNALEDLIEGEKNDTDILKMQNRYTLGIQQSTIDQLKFNEIQKENELAEKERQTKFVSILAILSVVIILLILILLRSQRKNNRQLNIANEAIKDKNEQLQNINATKDKFFSIISHDLKGPLNSLTSFSSLLMNHTESLSKEEIQMLATDLDKSLKNLFTLLENLLQWSRSQTGNIEFIKESFDLTSVLNKNKELLQQQAEAKSIKISLKQKDSVSVMAHEQSIDTVIRNLLSNAIKFTEPEGKIMMGVREDAKYYHVKIADNGVGMTREIAQKIFRIDTKHSTQGTAKEKGTGLGLILCKEFVEKNGGEIKVKSEVGKGSLFSFSIPKEA